MPNTTIHATPWSMQELDWITCGSKEKWTWRKLARRQLQIARIVMIVAACLGLPAALLACSITRSHTRHKDAAGATSTAEAVHGARGCEPASPGAMSSRSASYPDTSAGALKVETLDWFDLQHRRASWWEAVGSRLCQNTCTARFRDFQGWLKQDSRRFWALLTPLIPLSLFFVAAIVFQVAAGRETAVMRGCYSRYAGVCLILERQAAHTLAHESHASVRTELQRSV